MQSKPMTQKEKDKKLAKIVDTAKKWLASGYSPKQVVDKIWNKFGYTVEIKCEMIIIWSVIEHKVIAMIEV